MNYREVIINAIKSSGLNAKEISTKAGISESSLSRFLSGKTDITAENFFKLLNALPQDVQRTAKQQLGLDLNVSIETIVPLLANASGSEKALVLRVIADNWFSGDSREQSGKLLPV